MTVTRLKRSLEEAIAEMKAGEDAQRRFFDIDAMRRIVRSPTALTILANKLAAP